MNFPISSQSLLLAAAIMIRLSVWSFHGSRMQAAAFTTAAVRADMRTTRPFLSQHQQQQPPSRHWGTLMPLQNWNSNIRKTTLGAFAAPSTRKDISSNESRPVPVTLLSGFLGTGKTTTLQYLLQNKENLKIGVIVNDVASVNVDAKLVSGQTGDIVELQNGCACCSIADDLFFTVEDLLKGRDFDALVIELSGVGDPNNIRNNWKMAPRDIRDMAAISKVVTLVDSQTFGSDYMTWDTAADRPGWMDGGSHVNPQVSELLAEQVEAADLIVLNKIDLADEEQMVVTEKVVRALNDKANLSKVEFGKLSPQMVLGSWEEVADSVECEDPACTDTSHSHSHNHHDNEASVSNHNHHHSHEHSHSHSHDHHDSGACNDPVCTDPSHSHSHDHHASGACSDPLCTDPSHSHSHDHHDSDAACTDPTCTDTSHSHSHSHATSVDTLGISNFVYKATKPFDAQRLLALLNRWPIPRKEFLDLEFLQNLNSEESILPDHPFGGVLRSKGFCWFAPTEWDGFVTDAWRHDTAMFLSHAGRQMSVTAAGKWWASVPPENLPKFFEDGNEAELKKILQNDFVTEEFGDRRQELVFIGTNIDETKIREALDNCLLTDEEMNEYRQKLENYQQTTFV